MLTVSYVPVADYIDDGPSSGWYWSGQDLDGVAYDTIGPFSSRANAVADAEDCGVRVGFQSTARRAYPVEPTWTGAAAAYDCRRQFDYSSRVVEQPTGLWWDCWFAPFASLPFDPIYLGS